MTDVNSICNNLLNDVELTKKSKTEINEKSYKNIEKFKELKSKFTKHFGNLIDIVSNLPKLEEIKSNEDEEVSPASQKVGFFWEWAYHSESNKWNFDESTGIYSTASHEIKAYTNNTITDNCRIKVLFHQVQSFGCGGFGIMSKTHKNFIDGYYNGSSNFPFMCLCCTGPWSAKYINKKDPGNNMQKYLKEAPEGSKYITFEIDFGEGLFKVFNYKDELFGDYELKKCDSLEELVLIFYGGSSLSHSHSIEIE